MISAAAAEDATDERKLIESERKKEMKDADEGGSASGFFNAPQMEDTNEIVLPQDRVNLPVNPPATEDQTVPPASEATPPANPKSDFEQQAQQINSVSAVTPAQQAQLNALLNRYMGDEITTAQYQAERKKILGGQ